MVPGMINVRDDGGGLGEDPLTSGHQNLHLLLEAAAQKIKIDFPQLQTHTHPIDPPGDTNKQLYRFSVSIYKHTFNVTV